MQKNKNRNYVFQYQENHHDLYKFNIRNILCIGNNHFLHKNPFYLFWLSLNHLVNCVLKSLVNKPVYLFPGSNLCWRHFFFLVYAEFWIKYTTSILWSQHCSNTSFCSSWEYKVVHTKPYCPIDTCLRIENHLVRLMNSFLSI